MVLFALRSLATALKVGPRFFRFKPLIFASGAVEGTKSVIVRRTVQATIERTAINIALELSDGDAFLANLIIGKTITPLTSGRVTNVTEAGTAVLTSIKSLVPGGPAANPEDLVKVALPASVLPFVGEEVFEQVLLQSGVPKFVITFFRVKSVFATPF